MTKKPLATDLLLLQHHLTALGLPAMKAECAQTARECASANVDHLGFLLRLCERELAQRGRRATERRIKAARFPQVKSLDDFDFTAQPSLNRVLILELARCEFMSRRESVILVGNPGTGKTHVASGLALAACQRGKRVRFYRVSELLTQLLEAREDKVLGRLRGQLARLELLVLDELGYVPTSQVVRRAAVRRAEHGLRAYQRGGDDKPAVRAMDGGIGQREAGGSDVGSPDAPLPRAGGNGRELPLEGSATSSAGEFEQGSSAACPRNRSVTGGEKVLARKVLARVLRGE